MSDRLGGASGGDQRWRKGGGHSEPGPRPPPHSLALLAVIQHDGVIVAAGDDRLPIGTEVEAVDLVRVLAKHLGDAEAPQHAVGQLHGGGGGGCCCWRQPRRRRAGAGPRGERAGGLLRANPSGAGAALAASGRAADSRAAASSSSGHALASG